MGRLEELIDSFLQEHKEFLSSLSEIERDLKENFSEEVVKRLIEVMRREVEEHALREEEDLSELAGDVFDTEALVFAHDNIRERVEELEDLLREYEKGERSEETVVRESLNLIRLLRNHFQEEENIFFPLMRGEDLEHVGGED